MIFYINHTHFELRAYINFGFHSSKDNRDIARNVAAFWVIQAIACASFNADAFMYTVIQIKCFVLISIEKHMFTSMEITDTFCLNHGIHKLFRSFKVRHQR